MIQEMTSELLRDLDTHTCMGPDGKHPRVLVAGISAHRDTFHHLPEVLTGIVPAEWILANMLPTYNKGCKEDNENYKSVSLFQMQDKIIEIISRAII